MPARIGRELKAAQARGELARADGSTHHRPKEGVPAGNAFRAATLTDLGMTGTQAIGRPEVPGWNFWQNSRAELCRPRGPGDRPRIGSGPGARGTGDAGREQRGFNSRREFKP